MNSSFINRISKEIWFWIALFFIVHLSTITLPPLEAASTWRQTDGLMVARNFVEKCSNIFYPRVDVAGEKTGIIGCEFPLLNYLIYIISQVFGCQSWYGRLINVIVSSVGVFFFYKLIRRYFGEGAALYSSILVMASVWFTYSRTNIPDTFGASLCMISVYFGTLYLEEGKLRNFLPFLLLGLFGCLSKISSVALLTTLAVPFFWGKNTWARKGMVTFAASVIGLAVYSWYFYWVPHLTTTYGFSGHFFMGMPFTLGLSHLIERWPETLARFYDTPFKYTGFILFATGIIILIRKKYWLQLLIFAIPFTTFLFIIIRSGDNFLLNTYYVIMFILPMAFIMGTVLAEIKYKPAIAGIIAVVCIECIANQVHALQIRQPFKSLENLESILDGVSSERTDLIVINGDTFANPTPMYFAHRHGWVVTNETLLEAGYIDSLKSKGCKYVVVLKKLFGTDLNLDLQKVHDSEYFKIYKI